ncbi:uncharacterized protein LOC112589681 [Harpegnathos saltator]|uniref:uncharacterized protein LOC112589681 n=1 Tax=Harpegnathos saltator TaxID=610380 RepID=UPI000DBEE2A6|nr:uncharacterized protein LOC112589681 [Harpegnathos saltator]
MGRAKLVLLPKEGKPPGGASAYRPICLLDEVGKLLERIIADRLVQHLSSEGPDFHDRQYGFRSGRSTLDAAQYFRDLTATVVEKGGGMLLAVSLDIKNAFNTLPWPEIGRALEHHGVPAYLRRILEAYFEGRDFAFTKEGGWQPGEELEEARLCAEAAVASVVRTIADMGLKVAPHKTEAMFFHDGSRGAPPETQFLESGPQGAQGRTGSVQSPAQPWGPGWRARRLYATAVLSIALYGAPIWTLQLSACRDGIRRMRQALRPMYIRAITGYSTVSYMAATTLAGFPPVELLAEKR